MVLPRIRGAGARKPPREETAGYVAKLRVRHYGDFGAGGLLLKWVDRLVEKPTKGWRAPSSDRGKQNGGRGAEIDRRYGCRRWHDGERGLDRS
jgi:hypothetical protein